MKRRSTLKKHSKSSQRSEPILKRTKARGPVQRDAKEVLAEVLGKLTGKLDAPAVATSAKENRRGNTVGPSRDRLTVGVVITPITVTECLQEQFTGRTARGSIHALPFRSLREVECGGGQRGGNLDIRGCGEAVIAHWHVG